MMKTCDKMWNIFGKYGENHQNMLKELVWTIKTYAKKRGEIWKTSMDRAEPAKTYIYIYI